MPMMWASVRAKAADYQSDACPVFLARARARDASTAARCDLHSSSGIFSTLPMNAARPTRCLSITLSSWVGVSHSCPPISARIESSYLPKPFSGTMMGSLAAC